MKKYIGKGYIENSKFYYEGNIIKFTNREDFRSLLILSMAEIIESITNILDPICFIANNSGNNEVHFIKDAKKIASEDLLDSFRKYLLNYDEQSYRKIIGYLLFLSHKIEDKENNGIINIVNFLINISTSGLIDKEEYQNYLNDLLNWEKLIIKDKIIRGINDYDNIYDKPCFITKPDTYVIIEDAISLQEALKYSNGDTIININKNNSFVSIQVKNTDKFINYNMEKDNVYESLIKSIQAGFSVLDNQALECKYRIESIIKKDYKYISLRAISNISNYKIEELIYESKSC